jgi:hypothetical protein
MPSRVDEHELVVVAQSLDEAAALPHLQTAAGAVLKHQRRAFAIEFVVDADAVWRGCKGHGWTLSSPQDCC